MAKNYIGLDIGSSSVKVVRLRAGKKGNHQLLAFGIEPLGPNTIVEGAIMDQNAVEDAIRELWSRMGFKQKNVAIAIAGHSVIVKTITVPQMSENQLADHINYEAEHHIPFDKNDVRLDYSVTNPSTASGQMEVLLVAAKKEIVDDYVGVVKDAGLNPSVVEVAAFSSQNAYEANYDMGQGETVVLVTIGASISNINVIRDGVSLFTRDITIGGNAFTEEIQKQLAVSADEAEAYKIGGSYDEEGVVPQEVERIIEGVAEVMAGEIQRSLDFYLATASDTNVAKICLAGGAAKIGALAKSVANRSNLNVSVVDAWNRIEIDSKLPAAYLEAHSPEALVGVGLALRKPGDR